MKKGTERVIAHLPIDCATFLLNEKRAAIQELEARLRVSIVVLPSKHIETPAYDIERIKSLEGNDDKSSHLHLKQEEVALPEFAKQTTPRAEKAAVKEFLPDAPAPIQNKKTATSLIHRFWQRLIGQSKTAEIVERAEKAEKSGDDDSRAPRGNNRNQRPSRNNQRRNKPPRPQHNPNAHANDNQVAEEKTELAVVDNISSDQDSTAVTDNGKRQGNSEGRSRRGRNRRRSPRNGERRPEAAGNTQASDYVPNERFSGENDVAPVARPYASEFAERNNRNEAPAAPAAEPIAHNPPPARNHNNDE
jgi:ribonuclease E